MANPSKTWNQVPVWGIYLKGDDVTPVTGSVRLTFTQRVTRTDGRAIYPEGHTVERNIGDTTQDSATRNAVRAAWRAADEAADGEDFDGAAWDARWEELQAAAVFASFPASDDPDIVETGYQVKVEERLSSGTGKVYYIQPMLAHLDATPPGINLGLIEVPPGSPTVPAPIYAKGLPGGVAALSLEGDVLDAEGNVVGPPDLSGYATTEGLAAKVNTADLAVAVQDAIEAGDITAGLSAEEIAADPAIVAQLNVLNYGALDPTAIGAAITAAVAALPASGGEVVVPPGAYTLAATTAITKDNVTITFLPGATIKPTSSPSGTLASKGRMFDISGRTRVTLRGARLLSPDSEASFSITYGEDGAVRIFNSTDCVVQDCRLTTAGDCGILVSGPNAIGNTVSGNKVTGAGITYSYGGAKATTCVNNTVRDAPSNGLAGTGNNNDSVAEGCVISGNHVFNSGRMGIEDWGSIRGSRILSNTVDRSGNDPTFTDAGIGISAVGLDTLIQGNVVKDFRNFGIEVHGDGHRVIGNDIVQVAADRLDTADGVFVNSGGRGALVQGNNIRRVRRGLYAWHDCGVVEFIGNLIEDFLEVGIGCDITDPLSGYTASNNRLRITRPVKAGVIRYGITAFASAGNALGVNIARNHIQYAASAAVGVDGYEVSIQPVTPNTVVDGNVVYANGVTVQGLAPVGATPPNVRIVNNTFLGGATKNVSGLPGVVDTNNVVVA